ncbi:MAG: M23 family metallopeptidase [Spirochaetes bacterium]|jgi:murein DD-endopeptidase MepM/ murein hydrolase activator NlpD|nr:M23 family metallopeptidase [Spirochaetota bacterium]
MKKIVLTILLLSTIYHLHAKELVFKNLSRSSDEIKQLRTDIRDTIFTVKSNRDETQIPDLKFYKYKLQRGDNFWNVIARTTLNIDTLMTVNQLENPSDIDVGSTIFIPNMRGVVHRVNRGETINDIAIKYKVNPRYITYVNKMDSLSKEFVFIPCGDLTKDERSLFLSSGFRKPLDKIQVTSGYGRRIDPFLKVPTFHSGVDFRCSVGTSVRASRNGTVTFSGVNSNYGKLIIIKHSSGYESYYGHLSKFLVKEGQTVRAGQVIAKSGNTGRSTGPHLHFEIRQNGSVLNPLSQIRGL